MRRGKERKKRREKEEEEMKEAVESEEGRSDVSKGTCQLCAPKAGIPGSIPGRGTRSHMPQLRLKILCAATKTWHSQIKKEVLEKSYRDLS